MVIVQCRCKVIIYLRPLQVFYQKLFNSALICSWKWCLHLTKAVTSFSFLASIAARIEIIPIFVANLLYYVRRTQTESIQGKP